MTIRSALLTLLLLAPMLASAEPAPATPVAPAAPVVDNSARFYTKQSESGSTVLGNGTAEDGATVLTVRAPAVVGAGGASTPVRGARPGTEAISAAVNGTAPSVDYTSNAVRDDLKQREEKIATRVSQMVHRRTGLSAANAAANGSTATPPAGK